MILLAVFPFKPHRMVIACRAVVERLLLLLVEGWAVSGRLKADTEVIATVNSIALAQNFMVFNCIIATDAYFS